MTDALSEQRGEAIVKASTELLIETINQCSAYFTRTDSRAYYDGSAAAQFQAEVLRNRGPRGQWTDDMAQRLSELTAVYLVGSRNYLTSLLTLVKGNPSGPGLVPIVRSISEAGGKSAWLLDNRIGLASHARERVARLLLDELDDASRRKTLGVGLQHPDRAIYGDKFREAKEAIGRPNYFWGTEIERDEKGTLTVRKQTLPGLTQLIELAAQIHDPSDITAKHVYGYLSALSHPTKFAYIESMIGPDLLFCGKLVNHGALEIYNQMRIHSGWTQENPEDFPEGPIVFAKHNALDNLLGSIETDLGIAY
jgi:hypothetical protein